MLKKLTFQRWLLLIVAGLFFLNTSAFSQNREISGSVTSSSSYFPGTTTDLDFTVTVSSPDWEYLETLTLVFPAGVTINSASTLDGDAAVITGQTIVWDTYFGPGNGGGTWLSVSRPISVNVSVGGSVSGDLTLNWTMDGDGYGAAPNTASGTTTISEITITPGVEILTTNLDLGFRPINAWKKSGKFEIVNNPGKGDATITASEIDDASGFFALENPVLPYLLEEGETLEVGLTTGGGVNNGDVFTGTYGLIFSDSRALLTATYTATAYTPVAGNVWESAVTIPVTAPYGSGVFATAPLYNVYELPGAVADGKNFVYKFTIPTDRMFNLSPLTTVDAKWALYTPGFNGVGGPDVDNALVSGTTALTNYPLYAGTYYVVFSTTGANFDVYMDASIAMPLPVAVTNLNPADGAINVNNGMSLGWAFGNFTDEYRLIIGTTYPPSTVLIDWTGNLATSYVLAGLQPNMQYFWRVDARNTSGTTLGEVWGFTTSIDVPAGLTATVLDLGPTTPTVSVNLAWTANSNRAFVGYNVYRGATKLTATPITATTYTDLNQPRGTSITYNVTTVFDEGESAPASVTVTTKGVGVVNGTVTDQLTAATIAGATVQLVGNQGTYTFTTAATGTYSGQVYAGTYAYTVSYPGYNNATASGVVVAHAASVTRNFQLLEFAYPVDFVIATQISDAQVHLEWGFDIANFIPQNYPFNTDGMSQAQIAKTWKEFLSENHINADGSATSNREMVEYQIYREKVYQPGSAELIGVTGQNQFVDFEWDLQDWGVYRWNVVVVYTSQFSAPTSSNKLDKDMETEVDVTVTLNSNENPSGTVVTFENISEPELELEYSTLLGSNGTYTWDAFRRGTYNIEVSRQGYATITESNVDIFDASSFEWLLIETLAVPTNLYVTPTGLATWTGGSAAASEPFVPVFESFDAGMPVGWTQVRYNGTDGEWEFCNNCGYLYDPINSDGKFMVCDSDGNSSWVYDAGLFTAAIDMTGETAMYLDYDRNFQDYATVGEIEIRVYSGGTAAGNLELVLDAATLDDPSAGVHKTYSFDPSGFADPSQVYIEFWYSTGGDSWAWGFSIDNVLITNVAPATRDRSFLSYKVFLDGLLVAEVTEPVYQYGTNGEVLVDGQTYLAEVAAVYTTGQSARTAYTWTYIACDNYASPMNFTAVQVPGTVNVALNWTLPAPNATDPIDFARITRNGEVIAEVEGITYTDLTLAFGTYNYCITFVHESGAETCPGTVCESVTVIGGGFVNGNVKEAAYLGGANIEGAEITLTNTVNSALVFTFTTNAAGNYSGEVVAGTYNYLVEAEGYVSQTLAGVYVAQTATVTNNFVLMEYPYPVGNIVATEISDNVVQVDWSGTGGGGGTLVDFVEGFEAGTLPTGWAVYDVDGDGFKFDNSAVEFSVFDAHTGSYCMTSASYRNDVGALTPNNWLVTPAIQVSATSQLKFWVDAQDPLWAQEKYYVKVSTTGNAVANFTTTLHTAFSPATWGEVVLDLSAYAGQTIYIAFQHTECTDQYFIKIDDVTVTNTTTTAAFTAPVEVVQSTAMPFRTSGMTEEMIQAKAAEYAQANSSRELVGYSVYRTTCATGALQFLGFTLDQQFTDNTWGAAEPGVYKWGVVAEYDENASEIGFSNCLDKDMITQVSVTVITNSQDSPEGTDVTFTNTSEPALGLVYEVELDATGYYAWDEFRKGTYDILVEKNGFAPIAMTAVVIDGPEAFEFVLEELLLPVSDLYVTPTGFATWSDGGVIPFANFTETFDAGIPATWTITNGGSTADTWYMETPAGNPQSSGASIDGTPFAFVDSDEAGSGSTMDEILTSPVIDASNADVLYLKFDQYYNNLSTSEFARVQVYDGSEWVTVLNQTADAGSWTTPNHQVIDVTEYINDAFQVRFHYSAPGWYWYWAVDNVSITQEVEDASRELVNYKVWLDGIFIADTENTFLQYNTENLVAGQDYLAEVAAVYSTGMSAKMSYVWTYYPCETFVGPVQVTGEVIDETDVLVSWTDELPLELVQITQNPGAPANGYYQQYGYGYGVAYDMSAYPDALVNSVDFHHASWGLNGTWNYKIHIYNWDTKTLISTLGPFTTTGNDKWEMGVQLGNVSTGGANTVALLMEPLSNSASDAYPDLSSDNATSPQGSIYGPLATPATIGSSTIGNFLMEAYIYTAYGAVRATPVTFELVQAPEATSRIENKNSIVSNPVIKQDVNRAALEDEMIGANVYRDGVLIAELVEGTSYLDEGVEPGVYDYCVTYVYASGGESCATASCVEVSLTEICTPPFNLVATSVEQNNQVTLTWNQLESQEFRYDDGVATAQLGSSTGTLNTVLGSKHTTSAELTQMSWYLTGEGGPHTSIKIYVFGLTTAGLPDGNNVLYSATVSNTDMTWNTHTFPTPVNAVGGFFVGVAFNGFLGIGTDDGVGAPYVFQPNTHYFVGDYTAGGWETWETYGFNYNGTIRAMGVPGAAVSYAIPAPETGNTGLLTSTPLAQPVLTGEPGWSTEVNNSSREFLGFNIYRNNALLVSNWQTTTYTYLEGAAGPSCYTVTAMYSLCGESEPSNEACIELITGVENNDLSRVQVYPNPSNSIVNIDVTSNISRVIVYNYVGQVVFEQNNTKAGTIQLNVNNYESGAYLVKFVTSAGESFTKKVVVIK